MIIAQLINALNVIIDGIRHDPALFTGLMFVFLVWLFCAFMVKRGQR